jgi:hypothetical protein
VFGPWLHEFEPGLHTLPDGRTVMATERDLTFSDANRHVRFGPEADMCVAKWQIKEQQ